MKRKNKHQHEAERRAALRQRIEDIYAGVVGEWDPNCFFLGLAEIGRVVGAMQARFGLDKDDCLFGLHNLDDFNEIDKIVETMIARNLDLPAKEKADA